jgi:uncharacterized protein
MSGSGAASWPVAWQWVLLLAVSAAISFICDAIHLPGTLLLAPLIGGILLGVNGLRLSVPRLPYVGAQAVIGAVVATAITPTILASFAREAALFSGIVGATLLASAGIGWAISRSGLIPGAAAVYGISPGAAGPMVLLSEAQGADPRLVAFMQYSRFLLVALGAALVARFWAGTDMARAPHPVWFSPVDWKNLAMVTLLAVLSQAAARMLRLQAWALLGPMLFLSVLHAGGWLSIELPRWLLVSAYTLIGWHIGLGFSLDNWKHARRALPVIVAASLCLIGFCTLFAWCLTRFAHIDGLTAYLATSPGGIDSIAIIAASAPGVDIHFVLALQAVRLLLVIVLAPPLVRMVVRYSPHLR